MARSLVNLRLRLSQFGSLAAAAALLATSSWGAGCGAPTSTDEADPPLGVTPLAFDDVTTAAGLPEATSDCAVFRDLDGDGRADVLLSEVDADGQFDGRLVVFRNMG